MSCPIDIPPGHILSKYGALVDERVGIVKNVHELRREAGTPHFVYCSAETCNLKVFNPDLPIATMWGAGVATNRAKAVSKALGEATERYCAATFTAHDFPLSTFASAPFKCVDPKSFALFSSLQYKNPSFPFVPFGHHTPVRWVPALDPLTEENIYVPAAMVFLPYIPKRNTLERPIIPQISTGLACHTSASQAAITALCEVIERDAIALTWQAMLTWPQISLNTLSSRNTDLLTRLARPGVSIVLLYLWLDHGIPSILSVMTSTTTDAPALVIAAATHLNPELAIEKSLEELAQSWTWAQRAKLSRPKFSLPDLWENTVDPESHAATYFHHRNAHMANFLLSSKERVAFSEIKNMSTGDSSQDLHILLNKLRATNHRALLVNVTSSDIQGIGLFVVRAIVPGFHPLFMGHTFRALGGNRLWHIPQALGHKGVSVKKGDNPLPHPFA